MSNELLELSTRQNKELSYFIENQFPAIYREHGGELVALVKAYYQFLEKEENQAVFNSRNMYEYRDIDGTLENMLLFFKTKFLNGLFFEENIEFIVKHILDLYRRKGSKEGIELFFRLFFNSEVEIYYPSFDIFKPSRSNWVIDRYLQLDAIPLSNSVVQRLESLNNQKILGSLSKASAFIDSVFFINKNNSTIPILFVNDVNGTFVRFDQILLFNGTTISTEEPFGRIFGSFSDVILKQDNSSFSANNRVGDNVLISSSSGEGAKGIVQEISNEINTEIDFILEEGGFGYIADANTASQFGSNELFISQQSIFLDNDDFDFVILEKVKQINSSNTEIFATVVDQTDEKIAIVLDDITLPFEDGIVETVDRTINISKPIAFLTPFNDSADFEVKTIGDLDQARIIGDKIEDFLNVSLDESNYSTSVNATAQMSGTIMNGVVPTLTTPLNEAFVEISIGIGEIKAITIVDRGLDYLDSVSVLLRQNFISNYNLTNQIIELDDSNNVLILEGDFIEQEQTLVDWNGNNYTKTIKGKVLEKNGSMITIKQMTFEPFVLGPDIFIETISSPLSVVSIERISNTFRDNRTAPMGSNALVRSSVEEETGKIEDLSITSSGIGYTDGQSVFILNTDKLERLNLELDGAISSNNQILADTIRFELDRIEKRFDATGTAVISSQGFGEGRWLSFESHTNREKKLQDSFFYQDYSYEITSEINQEDFDTEYRSIAHPAGIKYFAKMSIRNVINIDTEIEIDIIEVS